MIVVVDRGTSARERGADGAGELVRRLGIIEQRRRTRPIAWSRTPEAMAKLKSWYPDFRPRHQHGALIEAARRPAPIPRRSPAWSATWPAARPPGDRRRGRLRRQSSRTSDFADRESLRPRRICGRAREAWRRTGGAGGLHAHSQSPGFLSIGRAGSSTSTLADCPPFKGLHVQQPGASMPVRG